MACHRRLLSERESINIVKPTFNSDTFNNSHIISLFALVNKGNKIWQELRVISGYLTFFSILLLDSHMNYVEYLLNLTPQLDNTSLAQPSTKQCFMLFSVCVKRALAITENTLQQNMWSQICINVTGSHWMKNFGE